MWMRGKGLGTCARQLLKEVGTVRSMDVILPVEGRGDVRLRVVAKPDRPVAELRLGVILRTPKIVENVVEKTIRSQSEVGQIQRPLSAFPALRNHLFHSPDPT
jgi:hypothetical protein